MAKRDLAEVMKDGFYLKHIREQTPELCLAEVQQTGWALKHVKEQTPSHQSWRFIDFRLVVNTLAV